MAPKKSKSVEPKKGATKKVDTTRDDLTAPATNTDLWVYGDGVTPKKLLISSWNLNGYRAVQKKGDLQKYLDKHKPDIICFNETKLNLQAFKKQGIQKTVPKEYFQYWNFCKNAAGYSGVAIFSKFKAISCKEDIGIPKHDQEGRIITLEFDKFYLVTAYIPNAGQGLPRLAYRTKEFDPDFAQYLQSLRKKKHVILCGDLNVAHQEIDISRPKGNEKTAGFTVQERAQFTKLLGLGYKDTFRELHPEQVKYSWWSTRTNARQKNLGWRLDYFVVDEGLFKQVKSSEINNDIFGSDHCPIELTLEFK